MRILYGIAGEGMGHAVRSRVVIEELVKEHEVRIVASGRACAYLAGRFPDAHEIWSLAEGGERMEPRDWEANVPSLTEVPTRWPPSVRELYQAAEAFDPHAVLTDCESFAALFAIRHSLPLLSIDHIHAIDRCRHDPALLHGHEGELWRSQQMVGSKVPNAAHYIVTTFFYPLLLEPRTTLVPPILRPEVLRGRREAGAHLIAHLPPGEGEETARILAQSALPCRVYGLRPGLTEDVADGDVLYRPFSEDRFVDDLRTARAVIAYGSFTLLSEAVYLGKPTLVVPSRGHFGHLLNALYLERLGYGAYAAELDTRTLAAFLERLPAFEQALAGYAQDGNTAAIAAVRSVLAEATGSRRRTARSGR